MENWEKIELKERKHKSGTTTLYLVYCYTGGKRKYESLNLSIIPEKSAEDRRVNEGTYAKALRIQSERILGIVNEEKKDMSQSEKQPAKVFSEWMDEYLEYTKFGRYSGDSTYKIRRSMINIVKSYLTHIHRPRLLMSKIDKDFYHNLLVYVDKTYKNTKNPDNPKPLTAKTKMLFQTQFNSMLKKAVQDGVLAKNPFYELDKTETFKNVGSERVFLTVDEVKALSEVKTYNPDVQRTFLFCCFTGLRHSDMAKLKWRDIKESDSGEVLTVPAMRKTGKPIVIPLNDNAKQWLPERNGASGNDFVFNAPKISAADRALKNMAKDAGIDKTISFHTSRHTFATMLITATGDLYTTSKLLGHTNIKTTQIYADVVMAKLEGAVSLIDSTFKV